MKKFVFFIPLFLLYGCPQSIDVIPESKLIYRNETQVKIKGDYYYNNFSSEGFSLKEQDDSTYEFKGIIELERYLQKYDSVVVFYNDTISITHYKDTTLGGASKSILIPANWEIQKKTNNYVEYRYTFTEADYQEAVRGN